MRRIENAYASSGDDRLFAEALVRSVGEGSKSSVGFMGGKNKSSLFVDWTEEPSGVIKYWIYCPQSSDIRKTTEDLSLLKKFITDKYKKVSHE